MKIIRKGEVPENIYHETCRDCGTLFSFTSTDAVTFSNKGSFTIVCLICGYETEVLPMRIMQPHR